MAVVICFCLDPRYGEKGDNIPKRSPFCHSRLTEILTPNVDLLQNSANDHSPFGVIFMQITSVANLPLLAMAVNPGACPLTPLPSWCRRDANTAKKVYFFGKIVHKVVKKRL